MGSVNDRGRCHRCERWIEADSPSDSLRVACYDQAAEVIALLAGRTCGGVCTHTKHDMGAVI